MTLQNYIHNMTFTSGIISHNYFKYQWNHQIIPYNNTPYPIATNILCKSELLDTLWDNNIRNHIINPEFIGTTVDTNPGLEQLIAHLGEYGYILNS